MSTARLRHVLIACGRDPDAPFRRAPSYANEAWVGTDVVVRINYRGVGRLAREAAIAARLPREALHPGILDVGDDGTLEWSLSPRVSGIELGRAWATLTAAERERATHELAAALAAVHATPCDGIADDIDPPHTLPLADLLDLVDDIAAARGHRPLLDAVAAFVRDCWTAFDDRDRGLVHGDPHLENVLWDGTRVSALLDLEWSRPSWIHCDLETLLALAADPAPFASDETGVYAADYADVPRWLRAAYPAWFTHPRLLDRLDVLHASRTLGHLLEDDSPLRWQHLQSLVDGDPAYRRALG